MKEIMILIMVLLLLFGCNSNCVKQEKVFTLGVPGVMIQQGKQWNKEHLNTKIVWIDSCSYAERIDSNSFKVIIGDC